MAAVKWSAHAMDCMRSQVCYIAEQSQSREIAWRWASEVFSEVEGLANFPQIGHSLPEFPNTPYLEILVRKYFRVIYRIVGDTCLIVTVRRTSMVLDETVIDELGEIA